MSEIENQIAQLAEKVNSLATSQKEILNKLDSAGKASASGGTAALLKSIESMRKSLSVNLREHSREDLDQAKQDIIRELQKNNSGGASGTSEIVKAVEKSLSSLGSFDVARARDLAELAKNIKDMEVGNKESSVFITASVLKSIEEKMQNAVEKKDIEQLGTAVLKQVASSASSKKLDLEPIKESIQSTLKAIEQKTVVREDLEKMAAALVSRLSNKAEPVSKQNLEDTAKKFFEGLKQIDSKLAGDSGISNKDLQAFGQVFLRKFVEEIQQKNTNLITKTDMQTVVKELDSKLNANDAKLLANFEKSKSGVNSEVLEKFGQKLLSANSAKLEGELQKFQAIVLQKGEGTNIKLGEGVTQLEKSMTEALAGMKSALLSRKDLDDFGKSVVMAITKNQNSLDENKTQLSNVNDAISRISEKQLTDEKLKQLGKAIVTNISQNADFSGSKQAVEMVNQNMRQLAGNTVQKKDLEALGKSLVGAINPAIQESISSNSEMTKSIVSLKTDIAKQLGTQDLDQFGKKFGEFVESKLKQELRHGNNEENIRKILQETMRKSGSDAVSKDDLVGIVKQLMGQINKTIDEKLEANVKVISSNDFNQVGQIEEKVAELILNVMSGIDDRFESQANALESTVKGMDKTGSIDKSLEIIQDRVSNISVQMEPRHLSEIVASVTKVLLKEGGISRTDLIELDQKFQNYTKGAASAIVSEQRKSLTGLTQSISNNDTSSIVVKRLDDVDKVMGVIKKTIVFSSVMLLASILGLVAVTFLI